MTPRPTRKTFNKREPRTPESPVSLRNGLVDPKRRGVEPTAGRGAGEPGNSSEGWGWIGFQAAMTSRGRGK